MKQIHDRFSLTDLLRKPKLLRDLLRKNEQQTNLQYVLANGEIRRARYGLKSLDATVDLGAISSAVSPVQPPIVVQRNTWSDLAASLGGCITPVAVQIAEATHQAISHAPYATKIIAFYPFLGCNIISCTVPLIDRLSKGPLGNFNFVDADFSQTVGVQGDGSTKYFQSNTLPSELGAFGKGGLGWWETNAAGGSNSNPEPIGSYDPVPRRFSIDLRTDVRRFYWGEVLLPVVDSYPKENGHFYGQCQNSALREFFFGGNLRASSTESITVSSPLPMLLMGCDNGGAPGILPWGGRGFCGYFTDGTLTQAEVRDFHARLLRYLIIPKTTGVVAHYGAGPGQQTFPDPTAPGNQEPTDCEDCVDRILVSASGEVLVSASGKVLLSSNA